MNLRKAAFTFLAILFSVIISYLVLLLFLNFNNNLKVNGQWSTTKSSMAKRLSLTYAFFTQSPALSREQLNLGAWNGYNEVIYKDPLDLKEINFKALFNADSYVVVIFNKSAEGLEGIRIGPYYLYRNIYFKADNNGRFTSVERLSPIHVEPGKWRNISINSDGKRLNVFNNGKQLYTIETDFKKGMSVGFRGGEHDVWIDDVVFKTQANKVILEDFSLRKRIVLPLIVMVVLCFIFLIKAIGRIKITNSMFFSLVLWSLFFIVLLAIVNAFYFYVQAPRYPKMEGKLKQAEEYWITDEENRIKAQVRKLYASVSHKKYRILFLGSSQTWGAGAAYEEDVFVNQMQREFDEHPLSSGNIECINGAVSGTNAKRLYMLYRREFFKLHPDMVVINLSNNDNMYDEKDFKKYLQKFAEMNHRKGIKTVFILEPNSIEHRYFLPLHESMREVALKNKISIVDLHDYLRRNYDSGFIWWDSVHMSSYGHSLVADYLYSQIKTMVE